MKVFSSIKMGKGMYIWVGIAVVAAIIIILTVSSGGQSSSNLNTDNSGGNTQNVGTGAMKEFNVTAKQFEFIPSTIEVNEGDTVKINIKSVDVAHGIAIPEFGVSEKFGAGESISFEFVADKAGTYPFFCNVFCGEGHRDMTGTLIVH